MNYASKFGMVNGEPLEPDKTYTVAGMDYLVLDNGDGTV